MSTVVAVVVTGMLGYMLGAVPWGLVVGRAYRGIDIREFGSGKTGFTNTLRAVGLVPAILVVALDIGKGAVPVLVGAYLFDEPWAAAIGGVAAVLGHTWPVFAGFRGGRGVATTFGAFLAMSPPVALALLVAAVLLLAITRYVSLMSMTGVGVGFLVLIALVLADRLPAEYLLFGAAVTASVELNHLENLRRLLAGTEPKLGRGGARRSAS